MPYCRLVNRLKLVSCLVLAASTALAAGQPATSSPREFAVGRIRATSDLPPGRLRIDIENLPPAAKDRAVKWLQSFHFTEADLGSLQVDRQGGILYVCTLEQPPTTSVVKPPPPMEAAVPVNPFPSSLVFHSRPGAPNVLYINFTGETVSNTEWNTVVGRSSIPAVAFSTDSDYTTFSDAEQLAIKRIWQRMAEDYAPFNIDVTTERPASFNTRTAHALITRTTDANGQANPYSSAGGVAYVNVFGTTSYANYRPAWVYYNNLGNNESYIAEAASHEVGHNLGLSHDGTSSSEYYGGHGSDEVSWGPLMGTGYNRNVSQWCKGEYYQANNTQDDLATIAGKISYRTDDHGATATAATPLVLTGTNIVSTTPENDPAGTNTANRGVLERTTDVDVFSFITGSGTVALAVNPWISPSGLTRGGNLDLALELYNETGSRVATNNPASQTTARIQTNLSQGRYFLHVRNSGAGNPTVASPTGYTSYGSIGQFFISGYVVAAENIVIRPLAQLDVTDITLPGVGTRVFTVTYSDDVAVKVATLDSSDIRVVGPNGYDRLAQFISVNATTDGTPRVATYAVQPPAGATWTAADNGIYSIYMQASQVTDNGGASVLAGQLGQFAVAVPVLVYSASMSSNPGWTLEPEWQYGPPNYGSTGPSGGFTGPNIVGYNLSGNYGDKLSTKYATTPAINTVGNSTLTLRFRRWLRLASSDTASIEASTNGTAWVTVWSTSSAVLDSSWQEVQYSLPLTMAGSSTLRLRWGLRSNPAKNDIGWNIDDVELLGNGVLDTTPPVPSLSVADLTMGGSPGHSCVVTYTDDSGIRLASLDSMDLAVLGPNGYSNRVEFVGADLPSDGSPCNGSYTIPAPGGLWDAADNGTYQVTLIENEVEDVVGNALPGRFLGAFTVAIMAPQQFSVMLSANNPGWGTVSPSSGFYTSGTTIQLQGLPAPYYRFQQWRGDLVTTNNPLFWVVSTNLQLEAVFQETVTTNYSVPHWWLVGYGYIGDFETVVTNSGANAIPVWQSYIAGLVPTNPASQLRLRGETTPAAGLVLSWNTVSNRAYTLIHATNPGGPFAPIAGASSLPWTTTRFTNSPAASPGYFRVQVNLVP